MNTGTDAHELGPAHLPTCLSLNVVKPTDSRMCCRDIVLTTLITWLKRSSTASKQLFSWSVLSTPRS